MNISWGSRLAPLNGEMLHGTNRVIDIGSNSVPVIMDIGPEGEYHQMENVKETVRLVENTASDGSLQPRTQARLRTLSLFARLCVCVGGSLLLCDAAVRRAPKLTNQPGKPVLMASVDR